MMLKTAKTNVMPIAMSMMLDEGTLPPRSRYVLRRSRVHSVQRAERLDTQ
jgi:hypothetical protein